MKRLSAFCFLLSALVASAATLTVPVADLTQGNVNNRRLTLTSTDSPRQSGAALITVEPKTQFTDSNGTTTFTNVLWGNYRLDIAGTPGTAFRFFVPDTNATLSVLTLITNHTAPNPATNFWNVAQADARFVRGVAAGTNGIATSTNNGVVTVHYTGSGGGSGTFDTTNNTFYYTPDETGAFQVGQVGGIGYLMTLSTNGFELFTQSGGTNGIMTYDTSSPTIKLKYDTMANVGPRLREIGTNSLSQAAHEFYAGGLGATVNAIRFGLVADGITDNTVALSNLFNSASSVFLPAGTYAHANPVIANSRVSIRSDGAVLKYTGSTASYGLRLSGAGSLISGVQFAPGQTPASTAGGSLYLNAVGFSTVENCGFSGTAGNAIFASGDSDIQVRSNRWAVNNCTFSNVFNGVVGDGGNRSEYGTVQNNRFQFIIGTGIYSQCANVSILNNILNGYAAPTSPTSWGIRHVPDNGRGHSLIENNIANHHAFGVFVSGVLYGAKIIGNDFYGCTSNYMGTSTGLTVVANGFEVTGATLFTNLAQSVFIGNYFFDDVYGLTNSAGRGNHHYTTGAYPDVGNAGHMTNLNGANIQTETINSNKLDAATWAAAIAGGTAPTYVYSYCGTNTPVVTNSTTYTDTGVIVTLTTGVWAIDVSLISLGSSAGTNAAGKATFTGTATTLGGKVRSVSIASSTKVSGTMVAYDGGQDSTLNPLDYLAYGGWPNWNSAWLQSEFLLNVTVGGDLKLQLKQNVAAEGQYVSIGKYSYIKATKIQ